MKSVVHSPETSHQVSRTNKLAVQPSSEPEDESIIKAKVEPQYILKVKDRPDGSDETLGLSFLEMGNELNSKMSKRVKILDNKENNQPMDENEDDNTPEGFPRSTLNADEQNDSFTSNIQTYFEEFNENEPLMNEMAQDFLTEMAMLGPEYDLRKLLGIPKPSENIKTPIDIAQDAKLRQITHLSALETTAVIAVLERTIDQLSILKHLLPASSVNVDTRYKNMHTRYGMRISRSQWKEYELPEEESHPAEECLKKIQNDREFVQSTLWRTFHSLLQNNNFSPMKTVVEEQRTMASEEMIMAWKWPVTNIRMQQARKILLEAKKALAIMPLQHSVQIREMQEGMSHAMLSMEVRKRYTERWETARRFQHKFKLSRQEDALRKKISELGALTVDEHRVGDEVNRYVGLEERRLRTILSIWEKRHEQEIEHVTVATLNSNLTLEVAQYHTQSVQKEYDGRVAELRQWNSRQQNTAKQIEAVLRVQKWWRHIIYRRRVDSALRVIRKAHIEFAKFAKQIIEHAESLALIEPRVETEEEKRARERKERLEKKKKDDGPSPEQLLQMALRKLNVTDRLALSKRVGQRKRFIMTKVLAELQRLLGDVEARRILEEEEQLQRTLIAGRRLRREFMKAALGKAKRKESELSEVGSLTPKDKVRFKKPVAQRRTRPHIRGISPRFSTPLTDRLARASFEDKIAPQRRGGAPGGSLIKALQRKLKIEGRELKAAPGGRPSQVEKITARLKKIEARKAKEAAKEAARRKKLGLMV